MKAVPTEPLLIGTVTLVNEMDHFVLIDTGTGPVPAKGTALKTFRDGVVTGIVSVGDVTRRPFVIADISNGSPQKGDQVFQ